MGVLFKQWIPNPPVVVISKCSSRFDYWFIWIDLASSLQPQVKLFLAVGLGEDFRPSRPFQMKRFHSFKQVIGSVAGVNIAVNVITCLAAVFIGLKLSAIVSAQ